MQPKLGDILADKYQLTELLGEGGMSMVFAAVNTVTRKSVAIKYLQPELVSDEEQTARLMREAQLASSIDHPNVVNVFDLGRHAGAVFLVMELLHGETLLDLLNRGRLSPTELIQTLMPVLRGVHAAHRVGVIHRDLKPENIFLCRDADGEPREPKVLDFGISKIAEECAQRVQTGAAALTREGIVFGTPQYTSPEQFRDAHSADARSDVYALGVILYYALSGRYPFTGETISELAIRVVEGNAKPLSELCPALNRDLCAVVMRAMACNPDERYPSILALAEALEPFGDGVSFAVPYNQKTGVPTRPSTLPAWRRADPPRATEFKTITDAAPPQPAGAVALTWTVSRSSRPRLSVPPPPPPSALSTRHLPTLEIDLNDPDFAPMRPARARPSRWLPASLLCLLAAAPGAYWYWQHAQNGQPGQRATNVEHPSSPVALADAGHNVTRAAAQAPRPGTIIVEQLQSSHAEPPRALPEQGAAEERGGATEAPSAKRSPSLEKRQRGERVQALRARWREDAGDALEGAAPPRRIEAEPVPEELATHLDPLQQSEANPYLLR